ncbi:MAG: putative iron export ATP-binding protein FetA [Paracidovorax wautersii]|uniref:Putative iron export ATP-binding protein FetA n=1 Tax=Paracidovorax wautersii TaxID=1177982 RepID=A0A7V8JPV3_9BURK|nr:MAG: putative iron export ATP-binding protein FetA [Paracidovorax wautersii]
MLRARQLRSAHGGPFDLDLAAGGCAIVTGPSGAGKSVLLRLLADLDPGEGEVWLEGTPRLHWSGPQWRRQVVYQSAEPAWWDSQVAAHFDTPPDAGLLDALGLPARLMAQPVERLSTGERQRLALVRSLARAPRVLLLDEPTAAQRAWRWWWSATRPSRSRA